MFEANVSQIGLLPAGLAGEVAGFYGHARGIVRDFLTINKGEPILILRDPYDVGWMAKRLLTSRLSLTLVREWRTSKQNQLSKYSACRHATRGTSGWHLNVVSGFGKPIEFGSNLTH